MSSLARPIRTEILGLNTQKIGPGIINIRRLNGISAYESIAVIIIHSEGAYAHIPRGRHIIMIDHKLGHYIAGGIGSEDSH